MTENVPGNSPLVPAVVRAVDILRLVAQESEGVKISRISSELGLPRNSTYLLVRTLVNERLLSLGDGGLVHLGVGLLELGGAYAQSLVLVREAKDILRQLNQDANETVHLAILDDRDVVYLLKEEARQPIRMVSGVGRRQPAHATAVGKVLLAALPRRELDAWLSGVALEQITENTITDPARLRTELEQIRSTGLGHDRAESNVDVSCLASPVFDSDGQVVAALSVSLPRWRMTRERAHDLESLVRHAAHELSARLGGVSLTSDAARR